MFGDNGPRCSAPIPQWIIDRIIDARSGEWNEECRASKTYGEDCDAFQQREKE